MKNPIMSFADLRSARKSKESKSFVSAANHGPENTIESAQAEDSTNTAKDIQKEQIEVFAQPSGLPTSADLRVSPVAGRGVFAKVVYSPGTRCVYQLRLGSELIFFRICHRVATTQGHCIDDLSPSLILFQLQWTSSTRGVEKVHTLSNGVVL